MATYPWQAWPLLMNHYNDFNFFPIQRLCRLLDVWSNCSFPYPWHSIKIRRSTHFRPFQLILPSLKDLWSRTKSSGWSTVRSKFSSTSHSFIVILSFLLQSLGNSSTRLPKSLLKSVFHIILPHMHVCRHLGFKILLYDSALSFLLYFFSPLKAKESSAYIWSSAYLHLPEPQSGCLTMSWNLMLIYVFEFTLTVPPMCTLSRHFPRIVFSSLSLSLSTESRFSITLQWWFKRRIRLWFLRSLSSTQTSLFSFRSPVYGYQGPKPGANGRPKF